MTVAQTYQQWREQALEEDRQSAGDEWKKTDQSKRYDYKVIRRRYDELRAIRASGDADQLLYYISEGLHGNMGGMGAPGLYNRTQFGTKDLITQYIAEVVGALDDANALPVKVISTGEKKVLFRRASACYGRTALMLGDAGSLGPFHIGVVKALSGEGLLPRIISGASAGSILAATIGTTDAGDLAAVFASKKLSIGSVNHKRAVDIHDLQMMVKEFVADLTFAQAYEKTGVHLNISVGPAEMQQRSRLLSATTSPNAMIREAVYASCAIPGVLEPVMLMAKDRKGNRQPYIPSRKWVDGSITDDQPSKRLARLYGVNYFISSQTNAWRSEGNPSGEADLYARWNKIWQTAGKEWLRAIYPVAQLGIGEGHQRKVMTRMLFGVLTQDYSADINIQPSKKSLLPGNFLAALSAEETSNLIRDGESASWAQMERIRITTQVAKRFDEILVELGEDII